MFEDIESHRKGRKPEGRQITLKDFANTGSNEPETAKGRFDELGLKHHHKKILQYLWQQYDYEKGEYREVHFSALVKECKLGKNNAKSYLDELMDKGIVVSRSDGYRTFYRLHVPEEKSDLSKNDKSL